MYQVDYLKLQKNLNQLQDIILDLLNLNRKLIIEKQILKEIISDLITDNITPKTLQKLNEMQLFETNLSEIDCITDKALNMDKQFVKEFENPLKIFG